MVLVISSPLVQGADEGEAVYHYSVNRSALSTISAGSLLDSPFAVYPIPSPFGIALTIIGLGRAGMGLEFPIYQIGV